MVLFVPADASAVEAPDVSASCRWHVSERPDGSSCDGIKTIVIAAEAFSQKGFGTGTGLSPKSYQLAEVANADNLVAVSWLLAHRCRGLRLTLAGSIPQQNDCIDWDRGGWSWC